jgi:putative phosphoesterase
MKVLVISDTHGSVNRAFSAFSQAEPVDAVIHLGDGNADAELLRDALDVPVLCIAGNCDIGSSAPRERTWECEGKRILLTHGDAYQVKSGLARLRQRAGEIAADAVLFGHTHLRLCEYHTGILLVNPGTLAQAAFHRSYAILTITPDGITSRHFDID